MKDNTRQAFELVIEKADKLLSLSFIDIAPTADFDWSNKSGQEELSITGPTSEQVDAFVLTLRFFIQENEHSSFRWLAQNVLTDPGVSEEWKTKFGKLRSDVNKFLDMPPAIRVATATSGFLTYGQILHMFFYGDLAHASGHESSKKRERLKEYTSNLATKGLITVQFVQVMYGLGLAISELAAITRHELSID